MKATALLKSQHREVRRLFGQLSGPRPTKATVTNLANDLAAHMVIEEQIFYPAVRQPKKLASNGMREVAQRA